MPSSFFMASFFAFLDFFFLESFAMSSFFMESLFFIWSYFISSFFMSSCFMASPDCAKARAPNSMAVDISFTSMFLIGTSPVDCFWNCRPDSAGPGMRCGERGAVTGLRQPKLDETEKSRHQICTDGGDQRSTRKT